MLSIYQEKLTTMEIFTRQITDMQKQTHGKKVDNFVAPIDKLGYKDGHLLGHLH